MCGRPAVPSTRASDRLTKSILVVSVAPYFRPGWSSASPLPVFCAAAPSSSERLKLNCASTRIVIRMVPLISSTALTIWTQVVPFMPPTTT